MTENELSLLLLAIVQDGNETTVKGIITLMTHLLLGVPSDRRSALCDQILVGSIKVSMDAEAAMRANAV